MTKPHLAQSPSPNPVPESSNEPMPLTNPITRSDETPEQPQLTCGGRTIRKPLRYH